MPRLSSVRSTLWSTTPGFLAPSVSPTRTPKREERLLRLNLFAPLRLTRAILPGMIGRGSGTIVDVASSAAFAAYPGTVYYGASKAGYANASEVLRGELRGTGVHVVTVYPGPIETEMSKQMLAALEDGLVKRLVREASPEELARRIRLAVEKKKPRVIYPVRTSAPLRYFPGLTRYVVDRFTPGIATGSSDSKVKWTG